MDRKSYINIIESMIDESKTAVLATADAEGRPHMRWMTPTLLWDRPGAIYAVTSPDFSKSEHLARNRHVQWMFQTRMLDKIATVHGVVNVIDNSAMKGEVLEGIGRRLNVFWRINTDPGKLIVLETILTEGVYFEPMRGVRETVSFGQGTGVADGSQ